MNKATGIAILLGMLILACIFLVIYVLTSLSYKKIFKAYGYANTMYAFIPFLNLYVLANLTCGEVFTIGEFQIPKKYFIWWWLVALVASNIIPIAGNWISLILTVICLGYCHNEGIKKIDSSYDNKLISYISSLLHIVLWVLVLPKKVD